MNFNVLLAVSPILAVAVGQRMSLPLGGSPFVGLVLLYSVGAHSRPRTSRWTLISVTVVGTAYSLIGLVFLDETFGNVLANYFLYITAWLMGDNLRRRRERTASAHAPAAAYLSASARRSAALRSPLANSRSEDAPRLSEPVRRRTAMTTIATRSATPSSPNQPSGDVPPTVSSSRAMRSSTQRRTFCVQGSSSPV